MFLHSVEVKGSAGLRSLRRHQGRSPPCVFQLLVDQVSLACGCIPPASTSAFTWLLPCVSSLIRTSVIGLGANPSGSRMSSSPDPSLDHSISSAKTLCPVKVTFAGSTWTSPLGTTMPPTPTVKTCHSAASNAQKHHPSSPPPSPSCPDSREPGWKLQGQTLEHPEEIAPSPLPTASPLLP